MENVIEKLRELIGDGYAGYAGAEKHREINDILDAYKPEGYEVTTVDTSYEEGGRWSNYETAVDKVTQADGKVAYFSVRREVPATEMQEGGWLSVNIKEVIPKEVTVTKYVSGRSA